MSKNRAACKPLWIAFYALFCAFFVLLFCSKSSFLYPINDWYDANVYLTAGKGILNGRVMYRDLYDHKGPLLYAMHALCALIDGKSFIGVFLLEILLLSWSLISIYRLFDLYKQNKLALPAMALYAVLVCSSASFAQGDSAEELCMPLMFSSMVSLLRYFKESDERMPRSGLLLQGVLVGCVFWMKFTCVGIQAGILLALLLRHIRRKQWKELFGSTLWLLCGFALSTIPWLIYFGINGAVRDWLRVYLYDNLFRYSGTDASGLIGRLQKAALCGVDFLGNNLRYTILLVGGLCWIAFDSRHADRWECGAVWLAAIFGSLATFIGGKDYVYYGFSLAPLAVFGLLGVSRLIMLLFASMKKKNAAIAMPLGWQRGLLCCWTAACIAAAPLLSCNVQRPTGVTFRQDREDTMQYRFAKTINQVPQATLLNYFFMDAGFYTAAGIAPNVKYYHYCNVPLPEMLSEQNRYVTEELVDFVVTRGRNPSDIEEHYVLVDSCPANDQSWYDTVYLFARKNLGCH